MIKMKYIDLEVGAIVMATGYDLFNWEEAYGEYGYGKYPDVISSLHFERLVSAGGPTSGQYKRPSDGKNPRKLPLLNVLAPVMIPKARAIAPGLLYVYSQACLSGENQDRRQ
jgi:hypothetical protein